MKKLPHELELEELLSAIKNTDTSDIKIQYDDPILSFTQAFKLTPGQDLVSSKVLYKLFKLWHPDTAFSNTNFSFQLSKYIPRQKEFYLVNKNFLSISKQIQDLLSEKKKDKTKSKTWSKHYHAFLEDTGIESGSLYVEADILYYLYNRWRDNNKRTTLLSYENFCKITNLHFEKKRLTESTKNWYGVSKNIKSLITREEVERWRESKNNAKKKYIKKDSNSILYKKTK